MRIAGYIAVWAVLTVATLLELSLLGMPMPYSLLLLGIIGLALLKAVLIALFYQHLINEARGVAALYVAGLLTGLGLIVGMMVSVMA